MHNAQTLKQPKVLEMAFLTSMCERFGYILFSFLFVLYVKDQFAFTDTQAFTFFGAFTAFACITPAIGGYLADHVFGIRRCIIVGLVLETIGFALLSIPSRTFFALGISFVVLGVGLFKTGPTDLMARAYKENDPRVDSGFTLFYMGMNIGGLFAPIAGGVVQHFFGWSSAFLVAAGGLFVGLILYFLFKHSAEEFDAPVGKNKLSVKKWLFWLLGLVGTYSVCFFFLSNVKFSNILLFIVAGFLLLYFLYEIIISDKEEGLKILACLALIAMGMIFFVFYFQCFTSMNLFIQRSVDRNILGFNIPTTVFLSLDPVWILALSPVLAWLYKMLAAKNKDLLLTTKFPLGVLITSLCFFCLALSTHYVGYNYKISSLWIVAAFFLFALGELLVGALGFAVITKIAPRRLYGIMMGAWFLIAWGLAASVAGLTASMASVPDNVIDPVVILHIYHNAFFKMGFIGIIATICCFAVSPYIKKIAKLT